MSGMKSDDPVMLRRMIAWQEERQAIMSDLMKKQEELLYELIEEVYGTGDAQASAARRLDRFVQAATLMGQNVPEVQE